MGDFIKQRERKQHGDQARYFDGANSHYKLVRYLSDLAKRKKEWLNYTDEEEMFVQEFPKVELHVHLDGAFDPDFLYTYLKAHPESLQKFPVEIDPPWEPGRTLPVRKLVEDCQTARDYHKLCTCRGYRSLKEMLNCFEMFLPIVRGNLDLIERLAFDFCQRQWEQHVIYTEVRYSPHLLAEGFEIGDGEKNVVEAEMVLKAVTAGLRRGSRQFGITVNQILSAITWKPEWAFSTLELVRKYQDDFPCATIGIDIAAGEEHFDRENFPELYTRHYEMIMQAKRENIPITLHAGESTDQATENVRRAISEYGASRIGHGYRMVDNTELMNFVRESQCHVEVCPTSSVETGGWIYKVKDWKAHPCLEMLRHGISFSLSSDDPAVFHTSLAWQYRIGLAKMGLTREELIQTNMDAVEAAFCPAEEKDALRARIRRYARPSSRRSLRRSVSEGFLDRVYLDSKDYI